MGKREDYSGWALPMNPSMAGILDNPGFRLKSLSNNILL